MLPVVTVESKLIWYGLGQVGGVAISAALFQSILTRELHKRIHGPDAEDVSIVATLTSGSAKR